ncbi:MAG TPA: lipase maturation factor family protein [Candidatus Sulfotelmatobacter sp.]|nr:lipase maturation factor family protein [Candidatus Sulfotelmatobacter sp.]
MTAERPTYWLTRFAILRVLGIVYAFAFLAAARQLVPLVGHDGLLPADRYLTAVVSATGSRWDGFLRMPSLFWIHLSDGTLRAIAWTGFAGALLVVAGLANGVLMAILWMLYTSIVPVGQEWYGYGWEIQLVETGFLAIFFVPALDPRPFPKRPAPVVVIWLFRWLIARIMWGAGLIKLRGDACWRELTCLDWHYETQPIPNPLSPLFHFAPRWTHRAGVFVNHVTELAAPLFALTPTRLAWAAGALMLFFQGLLILSGNLSFLNWLTIVPILACFDDRLLRRFVPARLAVRAARAEAAAVPSRAASVAVAGLAVLVGVLSVPPVVNLLSAHQAMNTSFTSLPLVNTYGAFGSVGRERYEIVFEGTAAASADAPEAEWREYEFPAKPGNPSRRPPVVAPYQPRLDWAIWFAAMGTPQRYPWTVHLVWKLLHNDPGTLSLLANDPFPGGPPRFIRARFYRYRFAPLRDPAGRFWIREPVGEWLPALSKDDPRLLQFLAAYGWGPEVPEPSR